MTRNEGNKFQMKDMLESLPVSKSAVSWYLGELKSQKAFNVLRLSHVALRDCNEDGELLAEKVDNIVLVEALRCKTETGNVNHILNCLKCNPAADTYRECGHLSTMRLENSAMSSL